MTLIDFFFIIKGEPLFGETLIEIKAAVAFFQNILPAIIFTVKTHFEFSFGININFVYSNSP